MLKIDNTGPSKPTITNSKNNVWSTGNVTVSLSSSDSGSGIARFEWYENGAWTTRAINQNGNTANITYTADRNATIRFRVVDKVGNVSSENTTIVKIDKTNPTAKISASKSGNNITVSASGSSDSGSGIQTYQYSRDNKTWYSSSNTTYTFSGLSIGSYTLYVKITDRSGRTATATTTISINSSTISLLETNWNQAGVRYPTVNPTGTFKQWSDVVEISGKKYIQFGNINLTNVYKLMINYSTYKMRTVYIQDENGTDLFDTLSSYTSNSSWNNIDVYLNKKSGVTGTHNLRFLTKVSRTYSYEAMLYRIVLYTYS